MMWGCVHAEEEEQEQCLSTAHLPSSLGGHPCASCQAAAVCKVHLGFVKQLQVAQNRNRSEGCVQPSNTTGVMHRHLPQPFPCLCTGNPGAHTRPFALSRSSSSAESGLRCESYPCRSEGKGKPSSFSLFLQPSPFSA